MKSKRLNNDARDTQSFKKMRRLLSAAAVLLVFCLMLTAPVGAADGEHTHIAQYSPEYKPENPEDYCLVCDVAAKINALPNENEIGVENAARVIDQIHAIDRLIPAIGDDDGKKYATLISLVDAGKDKSGQGDDVPVQYTKAVYKIQDIGVNPNFHVMKVFLSEDEKTVDVSSAKVQFQITPVGESDFKPLMLTMTTLELLPNSLSSTYYSENSDTNGWTYSYILPAGTYTIEEISDSGAMVGAEKFVTTSTTIKINNGDIQNTDKTQFTIGSEVTILEIMNTEGKKSTTIRFMESEEEWDKGIISQDTCEIKLESEPEFIPLSREGYTFLGWNTSKDGGITVIDTVGKLFYSVDYEGTTYTNSDGKWAYDGKELILYAAWSPNTYTVEFKSNGGDGQMPPQKFTYDTKTSLNPNTFTKLGYEFANWKDDEGTGYDDGEYVQNLTAEPNGVFNLTAQWKLSKDAVTKITINSDGLTELSPRDVKEVIPNVETIEGLDNAGKQQAKKDITPEIEGGISLETKAEVSPDGKVTVTIGDDETAETITLIIKSNVDENKNAKVTISIINDQPNDGGEGDDPLDQVPTDPSTPPSSGVPDTGSSGSTGSSSGSATDTGSGNYSEYPRSTENGGEVGFGTSPVVIKVILPEGTTGSVTLLTNPDTPDAEGKDIYYDFELDIPNYPEGGEGKVIWRIPASILNDEFGADDYGVYVFDGEEWKPLDSVWEEVGTYLHYTTEIAGDGNFIIVKEKGISEKAGDDAPVVVPGDEPQDTPGEVLPPSSGTDKPDDKEEEPKIPVLGLGIGLLLLILVIAGIVYAVSRRK